MARLCTIFVSLYEKCFRIAKALRGGNCFSENFKVTSTKCVTKHIREWVEHAKYFLIHERIGLRRGLEKFAGLFTARRQLQLNQLDHSWRRLILPCLVLSFHLLVATIKKHKSHEQSLQNVRK